MRSLRSRIPKSGAVSESPSRVFRRVCRLPRIERISSAGREGSVDESRESKPRIIRTLRTLRTSFGFDRAVLGFGENYLLSLQVSSHSTPPSIHVHLMVWNLNETCSVGGSCELAG